MLFKKQLSGANHMHLRPYKYPKLFTGTQLEAEVLQGEGGLWYPANFVAHRLCEATGLPYFPDQTRDAFKAIGIKFIAKQPRIEQP